MPGSFTALWGPLGRTVISIGFTKLGILFLASLSLFCFHKTPDEQSFRGEEESDYSNVPCSGPCWVGKLLFQPQSATCRVTGSNSSPQGPGGSGTLGSLPPVTCGLKFRLLRCPHRPQPKPGGSPISLSSTLVRKAASLTDTAGKSASYKP